MYTAEDDLKHTVSLTMEGAIWGLQVTCMTRVVKRISYQLHPKIRPNYFSKWINRVIVKNNATPLASSLVGLVLQQANKKQRLRNDLTHIKRLSPNHWVCLV